LSILGCNIAWGIIDAILYLLGVVSERGRAYALYNFVRKTGDVEKARAVIGEALPGIIADGLSPGELENMRERITRLPKPAHRTFVTSHDLGGALGVCILVVLSCFPLIIPLLLIQDTWRALRVSNGVAIIMLFLGGYFLAKYAGLPKILTGVVMVTLGVVMVGITVALGG